MPAGVASAGSTPSAAARNQNAQSPPTTAIPWPAARSGRVPPRCGRADAALKEWHPPANDDGAKHGGHGAEHPQAADDDDLCRGGADAVSNAAAKEAPGAAPRRRTYAADTSLPPFGGCWWDEG
jgi:hypothetical protein